ncbi:MAG: hypothetical protein MUE51_15415 [Thermoleophilia bacterium]|nr:hypothetical protein [Thermoleophilia bacterium]
MATSSSRKLSISLPAEIAAGAQAAAEREAGGNVSAWLAALVGEELRRQESLAAVEEWEREHGVIDDEALRDARARWLD